MVLEFLACLVKDQNTCKLYACFFDKTNPKDCSDNLVKFLFQIAFSPMVAFLLCTFMERVTRRSFTISK